MSLEHFFIFFCNHEIPDISFRQSLGLRRMGTLGKMRAMMWLAHALFLRSSAASPASGDIHLTEMLARRRKHVARTLKAWRIRHRAQPKVRFAALGKAGGRSTADDRGYKFTLLRPTKERVLGWFGEDAGPNEVPFAGLRGQFNHGKRNRKPAPPTAPSIVLRN